MFFLDPCSSSISVAATAGTLGASAFATGGSIYSTLLGTSSSIQIIAQSIDYTSIWFEGFDDPGAAGKRFDNAFKIDYGIVNSISGIFEFDNSAKGIEWPMQVFNNISGGEAMQTIIGNSFAHYLNMGGNIDEIGYYKGRTIVRVNEGAFHGYSGVSHGHYIFGEGIALNPDDTDYDLDLFAHEFGHTYASRITGPLYYFKIGIQSARGSNRTEWDANYRAENNLGTGLLKPSRTKEPMRSQWWEFLIGPLSLFK
jgi:hypothetical protein